MTGGVGVAIVVVVVVVGGGPGGGTQAAASATTVTMPTARAWVPRNVRMLPPVLRSRAYLWFRWRAMVGAMVGGRMFGGVFGGGRVPPGRGRAQRRRGMLWA